MGDSEAEQVRFTVSNRIDTYVALLRSASGLFAASEEVTRQDFFRFVERVDPRARYPGIQGIGFSERIPAARLQERVARIRASGPEDFHVWPSYPRAEYHAIVYLEPLDRRNAAAVGYDMYTEPVRRAAMDAAARDGTAAASGKVTLVQEIDPQSRQAGFLIYVPVYRSRFIPLTEEERLAQLEGFVYSPLRAGDFLAKVLQASGVDGVALRVYDGPPGGDHLLDESGDMLPAGQRPRFERALVLDVAGRTWTLVVTSGHGFGVNLQSRALPWILAIGSAVSLMLFLATRSEVRARTAAERVALELARSEETLRAREADLRRLVEAEREAHAEAAAASRAKDEFLATLSHELRTPLNAILGWATMLKGGQLKGEQADRAVEVIARNARTQADMIEDLLDVSRIITGKLRIQARPLLLAPAIRAALDAVRPGAEAKGVAVEWQADTDGPVLGDPDRLQQIAWNLVSNAIKFTPAGGRVLVRLALEGPSVVLSVRDNGIGIDPAFLPHVFDRFTQHDSSTTRGHGGMGLGLAIVRHLAELHGGAVAADSAGEGQGAAFSVRLPLRSGAEAVEEGAAAPRQAGAPASTELGGVRALVVDDEPDSRELLASVLTQAGASVVLAASAREALDLLGREHVDVVLADIAMPDADGYWLIEHIRSHPSAVVRALPALAVTARARQEDERRAELAGFQAHVRKPVDVDALRLAVRRFVIA
ncbi:MAG: multi-sensor hybrid histidine kinase [Acidobacteria bacterium]|nr:multi-sensor hybrid histidine kinase [Acidobacteriota bacterium]